MSLTLHCIESELLRGSNVNEIDVVTGISASTMVNARGIVTGCDTSSVQEMVLGAIPVTVPVNVTINGESLDLVQVSDTFSGTEMNNESVSERKESKKRRRERQK